jgi:predicted transcriptional regulator
MTSLPPLMQPGERDEQTNADWRAALRGAGKRATSRSHQGEVLNFETAVSFFGKLTERRWTLVHALQGQGAMSVRELARPDKREPASSVWSAA